MRRFGGGRSRPEPRNLDACTAARSPMSGHDEPVIKYLGSKKRLGSLSSAGSPSEPAHAPASTCSPGRPGSRGASSTWARSSPPSTLPVTRRSSRALRSSLMASRSIVGELERVIALLDGLPGRPGYVTETFCEQSRFFQPHNGARIDAIRE